MPAPAHRAALNLDSILGPDASRQDKVAALRAHLARVAPSHPRGPRLPSGLPDLDRAVGGWVVSGVSEVVGAPGSGRLSLVLPTVRALTGQGRTVAIVDPQGWLYPPGLDVPLPRLLLIRPGTRALWATEQLARSGAVPLVLLLDPPALGRGGRRLLHAAEAGSCALVLLTQRADLRLQPALRLECSDGVVRITRGSAHPGMSLHPPDRH